MEKLLNKKVALLLGGARAGGRSLAVSLARLGADVAIIYRQANVEQARRLKAQVEAHEQRCLIIPFQFVDEAFSAEAVRQTMEALGSLDIFIDMSSLEEEGPLSEGPAMQVYQQDGAQQVTPLAHVEIMSAALNQVVGLS